MIIENVTKKTQARIKSKHISKSNYLIEDIFLIYIGEPNYINKATFCTGYATTVDKMEFTHFALATQHQLT